MKKTLILFRHGQRHLTEELSGDGPLNSNGRMHLDNTVPLLIRELQGRGITQVDNVLVSGSVRCTDTWSILWQQFIKAKIGVGHCKIDRALYATDHEDECWQIFWHEHRAEFEEHKQLHGEAKAYLALVKYLIVPCAHRTVTEIRRAQGNVILVMTHCPHDMLIAERLTGHMPEHGLQLGDYRIIEFDPNYKFEQSSTK